VPRQVFPGVHGLSFVYGFARSSTRTQSCGAGSRGGFLTIARLRRLNRQLRDETIWPMISPAKVLAYVINNRQHIGSLAELSTDASLFCIFLADLTHRPVQICSSFSAQPQAGAGETQATPGLGVGQLGGGSGQDAAQGPAGANGARRWRRATRRWIPGRGRPQPPTI
jgi:hypothetical protein